MNMESRILLGGALLLLVGVSASSPGCKETPSCKLLYKRLDKCVDDFALKKDKFLERCEKKKNEPFVKIQIACSKHAECDAFEKCVEAGEKKRTVQRIKKEIEKALAAGKVKDALTTCRFQKKNLTEGLKKKCAEVVSKEYERVKAKMIKTRDSGVKYGWQNCSQVKELAKELGVPSKVKEAETLCQELTLADGITRVLKKVAEEMGQPKPILPLGCGSEIDSLKKAEVQTPWLDAQRKKLIQKCYVELGKKVLEKWLATKPRYCFDFSVRGIYKAVKRHNIQDEGLKKLIEQSRPVCKKAYAKIDAAAPAKRAGTSGKKSGTRPAAGK